VDRDDWPDGVEKDRIVFERFDSRPRSVGCRAAPCAAASALDECYFVGMIMSTSPKLKVT
jgi:hypothetical protein